MKKAIIVTPFDSYSYNVRIRYLEKYLLMLGYSSIVLSADFDHRSKTRYNIKRDNLELLHVPEYKKNISFSRIYSHYVFSKMVVDRIKQSNVDLVYVSGPPNILFKKVGKLKNREFKLLFEIGDMWPETIPISHEKKVLLKPLLAIWSSLRNKYIGKSDANIYECELFKNILQKYDNNKLSKTIYLSKENIVNPVIKKHNNNVLYFSYVGSINNIIDIDLIISFLKEINKYRRAELVIIGDGEKKNQLFNLCLRNKIKFEDYGIVYDDDKKKNILSKCSFGLNIMKESVCVGMTMKSLEYFYWGLVLINNIPADTLKLIDENECGYNITIENCNSIAKTISSLNDDDIIKMQNNSRSVYLKYFDEEVIKKQYVDLINEVNKYE